MLVNRRFFRMLMFFLRLLVLLRIHQLTSVLPRLPVSLRIYQLTPAFHLQVLMRFMFL